MLSTTRGTFVPYSISIMLSLTTSSLFVMLWSGHHVNALSAGASYKTCEHMTPIHEAYQPQTRETIFSVNVSATEYGPGEHINVTIQSECGEPFKGFLLQARRTERNYSVRIGSFSTPPGSHAVENCGTPAQAITQDDTSLKSSMRFEWTAPEEPIGDIVMAVTFVQDFATFWVKVRSAVIVDRSSTQNGSSPVQSPWSCPRQISYLNQTCANLRNCLGHCISNKCRKLVRWEQSDDIQFTFSVVVGEGDNKWIALGFSEDKLMGGDSVIECVSSQNRIKTYSSYNEDTRKANERLDSTADFHKPATVSASFHDGIFDCSFRVPIAGSIDFSKRWYLLIAWGNTDTNSDHKQKHTEPGFVSEEKISFLTSQTTATTTTSSSSLDPAKGLNTLWCVCLFTLAGMIN